MVFIGKGLNMLIYCTKCVLPNTKPDLYLDRDGVCSACRAYENRVEIDWNSRYVELEKILNKYRSKSKDNWDCIIPVSGGKDSTFQVLKILEFGLKPLCVTSTTCDLTLIGRENIENIKRLGVDYVEMSPNPLMRSRLNRIGLEVVGDISWPEHVGIFTIPVRAAVQFNVPLIIWGENSQNEYGGPIHAQQNNVLNRSWLEEFGGLLGLRVSDLIEIYGFDQKDLIYYSYPSSETLQERGIIGIFLGHYIPWDGLQNYILAKASGFSSYSKLVEGSLVNYENLDNYQTGIHDYFKFLKYGFGRASDIASLYIRRNRLTRPEAIKILEKVDGKFPWMYLGKRLENIIENLELSIEDFIKIADKFTNKKIFHLLQDGSLMKDDKGNLKKLNYDNK